MERRVFLTGAAAVAGAAALPAIPALASTGQTTVEFDAWLRTWLDAWLSVVKAVEPYKAEHSIWFDYHHKAIVVAGRHKDHPEVELGFCLSERTIDDGLVPASINLTVQGLINCLVAPITSENYRQFGLFTLPGETNNG